MDESDKDNLVQVKNSEENSGYIQIGMSGHWRFNDANLANSSMMACGDGVGPSYSSGTMAESFGQAMWEQSVDAAASLGYNDMNVHRGGTGGSDPLSLVKAGMFVPNMSGMLSQFPGDSNFIERAARFSSFSGGHIGELFNPFGFQHPPVNPYRQPQDGDANIEETPRDGSLPPEQGAVEGSPQKKEIMVGGSHREAKLGVLVSGNDSDEVELSCGGGTREDATPSLGVKKRKRVRQESESEHTNGTQQQSIEPGMKNPEIKSKGGGQNSSPTGNKSTGKQNSQNSDPPKDDYIHVRARRGQATNSHSLAERVRREKISERMKFLQDLVPGCNKVTGKAVMLDEIINYVQSLQRQVEFLSMKLATVNPRLDFNIEQLFAKDQQKLSALSGIGISPSMPMAYPPIHISQPPILQPSLPGIGNCSDLLRRTINSHLTNMGGYKEPTHQLPNAWEDEFDNVVQMGFIANAPLDNQEKNCPVDQRPTEADP